MKTKILTIKDMRLKKPADLHKYIAELETERVNLKQDLLSGKVKTTHYLKQIKRSIASAKMTLSEQSQTKESK